MVTSGMVHLLEMWPRGLQMHVGVEQTAALVHSLLWVLVLVAVWWMQAEGPVVDVITVDWGMGVQTSVVLARVLAVVSPRHRLHVVSALVEAVQGWYHVGVGLMVV